MESVQEGEGMKTLDEVIEAQERCLKYPNCHFCFLHAGPLCTWIRDALSYLNEYRDNKEFLRYWKEKAISEQQNIIEGYIEGEPK